MLAYDTFSLIKTGSVKVAVKYMVSPLRDSISFVKSI